MPRNPKRIFWLESDPWDESSRDAIRKAGYSVPFFTASSKIIERSRSPNYFSLVITEILVYCKKGNLRYNGIPWQETGLEFLRRLRAGSLEKYGFAKDIPVIVLTGVIAKRVETVCLRDLGVIAYLDKPYPPQSLVKTVAQALPLTHPVQIAN